jgi:fucose permease
MWRNNLRTCYGMSLRREHRLHANTSLPHQYFCNAIPTTPQHVTASTPSITQQKIKTRLAVSAFFFVNGFLYASWASRMPELKSFYKVNDGVLGTLLFMNAIGAIVAMPIAGWLTGRLGSKTITLIAGLSFCAAVPLITFFTQTWWVRAAFFCIGFSSGALDVSMNSQAVVAERMWQRSIMSSFHAVFSIGMALGAGGGSLSAYLGIAPKQQLLILSAFGVLLLSFAALHLVNKEAEGARQETNAKPQGGRLFSVWLLLLSAIAFCCMTGEGAMADWSAIYLHTVVGKDEAFSALAFFAFSAAMTLGRTVGDYAINRLGVARLLPVNAALSIAGLALLLALPHAVASLLGFLLVGLGLSTIVPMVYSTAGNAGNNQPGRGIAIASTIGYTGFFVGPPLIGYLSQQYGLRIGLCFPLVLFVLMLFLVRRFLKKREGSLPA